MPERKETEHDGTEQWPGMFNFGAQSTSVPSSSDARALPERKETEHDEAAQGPKTFTWGVHTGRTLPGDRNAQEAYAYIAYLGKKSSGEITDKDTQTELQPFSRPGRHLMPDNMTVYELKTIEKDCGIQTTGVKAILIARIERFLAPTF